MEEESPVDESPALGDDGGPAAADEAPAVEEFPTPDTDMAKETPTAVEDRPFVTEEAPPMDTEGPAIVEIDPPAPAAERGETTTSAAKGEPHMGGSKAKPEPPASKKKIIVAGAIVLVICFLLGVASIVAVTAGSEDEDPVTGAAQMSTTVAGGSGSATTEEGNFTSETTSEEMTTEYIEGVPIAISGQLAMVGEFTDELKDPNSEEHINLKKAVEDYGLKVCEDGITDKTNCDVQDMAFEEGSIVAKFVISFYINESLADDIDMLTIQKNLSRQLIVKAENFTGKYAIDTNTIYIRPGRKRRELPIDYGINLDDVFGGIPKEWPGLREGQATDSHSCDSIRELPPWMRDTSFHHMNKSDFYSKYTEAYNISIVGSSKVSDGGMRVACYKIRYLLASRYDIRNAIFKTYLQIGIIADDEQQTTLPEYSGLDSSYWDGRARGLGATMGIPMASVGDDNLKCREPERYPNNDILVHEFSHGVHQFGANIVIPNFGPRLYTYYKNAHGPRLYGQGAYATNNRNEYLAEGSVVYFGGYFKWQYAFRRGGKVYKLNTRSRLNYLDPASVSLLDEMHPCFDNLPAIQQLCCHPSVFTHVYEGKAIKTSVCKQIQKMQLDTLENCLRFTCRRRHRFAVFVWDYPIIGKKTCYVHECEGPNYVNPTDELMEAEALKPMANATAYGMDRPWGVDTHQKATLLKELPATLCTRSITTKEECDEVPSDSRTQCGPPDNKDPATCNKRGCCFADNMCFYKKTVCYDETFSCSDLAGQGECSRNPALMLRRCKFSCGLCQNPELNPYTEEELDNMCQDKDIQCLSYKQNGICGSAKYEKTMKKQCTLICGHCKEGDNLGSIGTDDVDQEILDELAALVKKWRDEQFHENLPKEVAYEPVEDEVILDI